MSLVVATGILKPYRTEEVEVKRLRNASFDIGSKSLLALR
jgi:hypothetical protein